ncbi:class I SAM-dependent DNA methyltransferase [[Clostridium] polysaccharolyticum]|uniref:Methyltransferase domain-containing protein n=1 Tax=[Clostridium] polysaccharolyticum TaxID=29364 RepID=A0A1I0DY24_9FIRM|nr:class I SAM-dependent methyltransferase [[Clostridium] polysaccharolyticum]SET37592.1 Methyltransferase domain-containing protein [[Clostridium] polysaccharolyticum]
MKKYFQIFERISNTYPDKIFECPLYYKKAADLYDAIAVNYNDYPMFLRQAMLTNGPILELCCGSGRLTLPLLKTGFKITAVDLSEDMLGNMKRTIESKKKYARLKDNLTIVNEDMLNLNLNEKYNLIMIGATSIRLMEKDFAEFFNDMYELLNEGGVFLFNFENIPVCTDQEEKLEPLSMGDLQDDTDNMNLIAMQRLIRYTEKRAFVNFISMSTDPEKKVLLSYTDYRIFGIEDIKKAAKESLFGECEIIKESTYETDEYFCRLIKKN